MQTYEIVADGLEEFGYISLVCGADVEKWDKYHSETQPETTVGSKCERTECVAACKLPHTCHELSETTVCERCIYYRMNVSEEIPNPIAM